MKTILGIKKLGTSLKVIWGTREHKQYLKGTRTPPPPLLLGGPQSQPSRFATVLCLKYGKTHSKRSTTMSLITIYSIRLFIFASKIQWEITGPQQYSSVETSGEGTLIKSTKLPFEIQVRTLLLSWFMAEKLLSHLAVVTMSS